MQHGKLLCVYFCVFSGIRYALKTMGMVLHGDRGWSQSADVPLEIATKSDKSLLIFDFHGTLKQLS